MSKLEPGMLARVKPPRPPAIFQWEYDQSNELIVMVEERKPHPKTGEPMWTLTKEFVVVNPRTGTRYVTNGVVERCLVPINPGDGQDEILRIAGLPVKETT